MFAKLSVKLNQAVTYVMSSVMGLLGFSCVNWIEPAVMYGMPTVSYEIKGKVTDIDGQAIEKARIVVAPYDKYSNRMIYGDTVYTDDKGKYVWSYKGFPVWDESWIKCEAPGRDLEPDSVELTSVLKNPNSGKDTATLDFILKPQIKDPQ